VLPGGWALGQLEWREKYFHPTLGIRKHLLERGSTSFFFPPCFRFRNDSQLEKTKHDVIVGVKREDVAMYFIMLGIAL